MIILRKMLCFGLCVFLIGFLVAEVVIFSHTDMYARASRRWRWANIGSQVGDIVHFGRYEQDDDLSNGPEDIEWIVLDKQDGRLLLMTRQALISGLFVSPSWEESNVKKKLNQEFYFAAFYPEERERILPTSLHTEDLVETDGWRVTENKIFILSQEEAERFLLTTESRVARGTRYADDFGWYDALDDRLWPFEDLFKWSVQDYKIYWWLRTPGRDAGYVAYVDENGQIDLDGASVTTGGGLRPVLWLDCSGGQ